MLIDEIIAAANIPLLPPPQAAVRRRNRSEIAVRLLSVCCAGAAAVAFTCSGIGKYRAVQKMGAWAYWKAELLGNEQLSPGLLGEDVATMAFGGIPLAETASTDVAAEVPMDLTPPYAAEEEIANAIAAQKAETEAARAALYAYDVDVPQGCYPILPIDLAAKSETELKNETAFSVDMDAVQKAALERAPEVISDEPLVLIVHTHGTEGFSAAEVGYYNDHFNRPRSGEITENTVAVGKALCDELTARGIPTVQCEVMHDQESYIESYARCADTIRSYLAAYPSIRYVFDVHRDSLIRSDLTKFRPVVLKNGEPCAQIMMLVGSNEKGAGDYDWHGNLVLAEAIQCALFADSPGVARALCLRGASYNQQYAAHSLLLEIGSCGNTLGEAKTAAVAFADAFADVLLGK